MSEALLRALNPKASFEEPGEAIAVLNVAKGPLPKVDKVEVLKTEKQLRAIDEAGKLVAFDQLGCRGPSQCSQERHCSRFPRLRA